jgi:hypothetical protein
VKICLIISFLFALQSSVGQQWLSCKGVPKYHELWFTLTPRPVFEIRAADFYIGCNVTDSIKNRLLTLLEWQWSPKELSDYLFRRMTYFGLFDKVEQSVKKLSKGDTIRAKVIKDSLIKVEEKWVIDNSLGGRLFAVDNGVLLAIGVLNLRKAIPRLRKGLKDPLHYDAATVVKVLAKLGDKKMEAAIIKNCKYDSALSNHDWIDYYQNQMAPKLLYIGSQESIFAVHQWLDTAKQSETFAHELAHMLRLPHTFSDSPSEPNLRIPIHTTQNFMDYSVNENMFYFCQWVDVF